MKIFAIINNNTKHTIGYFFYYEKSRDYYIELCEDADYWEVPFVLDHFVKRKKWTVNSYYTRLFVCQRIVPPDRQNIGAILKDNGLDEYDEIKLFLLAQGRCAQDDCYIKSVKEEELPEYIKARRGHIMVFIDLLDDGDYIVRFQNGMVGVFSIKKNLDYNRLHEYYKKLSMRKSGTEIYFPGHPGISYCEVYSKTKLFGISAKDLLEASLNQIMTTGDVVDYAGCTRQNINDLVKRGRLHPLNINARVQVFDKKEVMDVMG